LGLFFLPLQVPFGDVVHHRGSPLPPHSDYLLSLLISLCLLLFTTGSHLLQQTNQATREHTR
jgi:hypothetical protein